MDRRRRSRDDHDSSRRMDEYGSAYGRGHGHSSTRSGGGGRESDRYYDDHRHMERSSRSRKKRRSRSHSPVASRLRHPRPPTVPGRSSRRRNKTERSPRLRSRSRSRSRTWSRSHSRRRGGTSLSVNVISQVHGFFPVCLSMLNCNPVVVALLLLSCIYCRISLDARSFVALAFQAPVGDTIKVSVSLSTSTLCVQANPMLTIVSFCYMEYSMADQEEADETARAIAAAAGVIFHLHRAEEDRGTTVAASADTRTARTAPIARIDQRSSTRVANASAQKKRRNTSKRMVATTAPPMMTPSAATTGNLATTLLHDVSTRKSMPF